MASSHAQSDLPQVSKQHVLRNLLRLDDVDAAWVLNEHKQVRSALPHCSSAWLIVWKWLANSSNPGTACAVTSTAKALQRASIPWLARLRDETDWRWKFLRTFDPPSSIALLDSNWASKGWEAAFMEELTSQPQGPLPALDRPYYTSVAMHQTWGRLRFHPFDWSSTGGACWSFTLADSHPGQYHRWPTRPPPLRESNLDVAKGSVLVIRSLQCRGHIVDPPAGVADYTIQGRGDTITMGELVEGLQRYYRRWPRSILQEQGCNSCTVSKPVLLPNGRKLRADFQPGALGMDVDGSSGKIRSVKPGSQADTLGVEIGMRCLEFNGRAYCKQGLQKYLEDALVRNSRVSMTLVMMDGSWRANIT